jgi:hypothetical protein
VISFSNLDNVVILIENTIMTTLLLKILGSIYFKPKKRNNFLNLIYVHIYNFYSFNNYTVGFLYLKWQDILDYTNIAGDLADVTTMTRRSWYIKLLRLVAKLVVFFKKVLIVPLILLIIVNLLISLILGGFLNLIL